MKPIFRSTFMGGFHKKDVATFIAKQSAQFEKKIEDIQSRLDRSEAALEEERASFAADREELEAFRAKKANESASFEELAKLSSALSEKESALKNSVDALESMLVSHNEAIDASKKRLEEAEAFRVKAEKFDRLAGVLGEIVSGSQQTGSALTSASSDLAEPLPELNLDSAALLAEQREILCALKESLAELNALIDKISSDR